MWGFVSDLSSISSEEELQFVQVYIKKVTEIDTLLRGKFNFDITEQIIPYSQQISELDDSSSSSSYEFQENIIRKNKIFYFFRDVEPNV